MRKGLAKALLTLRKPETGTTPPANWRDVDWQAEGRLKRVCTIRDRSEAPLQPAGSLKDALWLGGNRDIQTTEADTAPLRYRRNGQKNRGGETSYKSWSETKADIDMMERFMLVCMLYESTPRQSEPLPLPFPPRCANSANGANRTRTRNGIVVTSDWICPH